MKKAEVTIYLSLVFILLLSFAASLIESASIQNAKNYRRADVNRALESVFAEYQKELLTEYDIFALEGSYETGRYSESLIKDRLTFYGAGSMEHTIKRIQLLTDNGCQGFYNQIAAYMLHKYGLSAWQDKLGATTVWKQDKEKGELLQEEEKKEREQLDALLTENEAELPQEDNPIAHVNGLKQSPLLELVIPKEMVISSKSLDAADVVSKRTLEQGYGDFSDMTESTGALSKLLFVEYLMEHFTKVPDTEKTGVLDYEVEYIIAGKDSDRENLEEVVKKLMLLRFVPNYLYIQSDGEMKAEAQAMAAALCTIIALPAASQAAAQGILLAWAFGETVVDIRSLLSGNKVAAVKTKDSWQLQLSALLKLGTNEDTLVGQDSQEGIGYEVYMRTLLFLEQEAQLGKRSLDIIEQNLRQKKGLSFFRADQCISRLEIATSCSLRRGITYRFSTYYGYN